MRTRRERDGGYSHNNVGFGILPEQLVGLTREQAMSATGTKDHGVSASYIRKMHEKGHTNLPIDEYIRMRNRGEREE